MIRPTPQHGHGGSSCNARAPRAWPGWRYHCSARPRPPRWTGFYTTNGKTAMGYYNSSDLPYYYSLFPQFTLCANYFCGVLSETYPNRLVLYSGASGGNISNDINNGTLNYPCVLDLLSAHGITFKNYNFHCPSNYSILALFKKWATGGPDNELNQPEAKFFSDCTNNTLPQVSFITEAPPTTSTRRRTSRPG